MSPALNERKVPCRDFLVDLFWQELEIVFVGLGLRQNPQQIKLRLNLDREGTRHLECREVQFRHLVIELFRLCGGTRHREGRMASGVRDNPLD